MRLKLLAVTWLALISTSFSAIAGPALVFEPTTGNIIYSEDADRPWHPASLTKIMTAYLTFEALRDGKLTLKQLIPYSAEARKQQPSKLGLSLKAKLTVDSALKALIIKSANDVAVMIAEAVGGSQPAFVAMMNNKAEELDMTRTNFVNPNGLPATQQITTARDMAKLARAVLKDFPEYAEYWAMKNARIGKKIRLASHNGLLNYNGGNGIKTGFICDSGYNVVGSATREGRMLIAVVLGERSGARRTKRAASLLEHGFDRYEWKAVFGMQTIDNAPMGAKLPVASIRKKVRSYACGSAPRKYKKKKKRKKIRRKKKSKKKQ